MKLKLGWWQENEQIWKDYGQTNRAAWKTPVGATNFERSGVSNLGQPNRGCWESKGDPHSNEMHLLASKFVAAVDTDTDVDVGVVVIVDDFFWVWSGQNFYFFAEETESGEFLFRFFFSRGPKQKSDFFRCRVFSDKFVDVGFVGSVVWRLRCVVARKERYDGLSRLKDFLEIWVRFVNKRNDKTTLACYLMKRLFRFLLGSRQQAIIIKVDYSLSNSSLVYLAQ